MIFERKAAVTAKDSFLAGASSQNALRMSCIYFAYFCAPGLNQSYFPIWLRAHSLGDTQIAIVLATPMLIRIVASPAFGFIADRVSDRRVPIRISAALMLLGALILRMADGFWPILLATGFMLLFWNSIPPMTDAITLNLLRRGFIRDYGRVRVWGSASFIVASIAGGYLLAFGGPDLVMIGLVVVLCVFNAVVFLIPPSPSGGKLQRSVLDPKILRRPAFLAAVLVGALVQASHAAFNGFGTLYLRSRGYDDTALGFIVGLATAAEVAMFALSPIVSRWVGPVGLLLASALIATARWALLALDPSPVALVLLQLAHAATFGASYLGVMGFIAATVHEERAGSAQSTYATMLAAITAAATLISGPVYAQAGGGVFLVAAAVAALGVVILLSMRSQMRALLVASK